MEALTEEQNELESQGSESSQSIIPHWRSLFAFTTRSHLLPLFLALVLSVSSGVVSPVLSYLLGRVFDCFTNFGIGKYGGPELIRNVSKYALGVTGLGMASGVLHAGYFGFWLMFGELQAKGARDSLFGSMLEKDMEWYDMRKDGVEALIQRLQTQIRELQMGTSQPLGFALQSTVTALSALGLALYTAWDLTLITIATIPLAALVLGWISARMQPSIEAQAKELNTASKCANNAFQAIDVVKCFNGQDFETWQYAKAIHRAAKKYLIQAKANALQIGFVRFITLSMFVQGFWYGSHIVITGKKEPGQVLTAFWSCLSALQAVEQILPQILVLEKGRAAGATLQAILTQMDKRRRVIISGQLTPEFCEGDIEVRNVSFRYPSRPDQPALKHASFFFPAGETTFVIGTSGSGKSTLGNLLMRFYEPASGEIFIDGNSLQTLDIAWLRNNITLVQQQSVLFNETIFKNIAFARRDWEKVEKHEVKRSIDTAFLQSTINEFPKGVDTVVGAGGNAMSGGQRQRVAIARASLRDTPILILDEATSALDHISKGMVMDAIREWRRGKTTIIITHDLSQIADDEFAYILDKGVVVQEGYRYALEQGETGPLVAPRRPSVNFPTQRRLPKLSEEVRKPSMVSTSSGSCGSTLSVCSHDSLDIQYHPRRQSVFVPGIFSLAKESPEMNRRSYFEPFVSPAATGAFAMHRMSGVPDIFARPLNQSPQLKSAWPLKSRREQKEQDLGDWSLLNELHKRTASAVDRTPGERSTSQASPEQSKTIPLRTTRRQSEDIQGEAPLRIAPIKKILLTVWPTLTWKHRPLLLGGFFCAAVHAAGTPVFSFVFSKLLATFFQPVNREREALKWSLSVLAVGSGDALASFFMHYLLEACGQAWVDNLRIESMKRIIDQPRTWFDKDKNSVGKLTECLDRNAEEMRNLLGRFAGFMFVVVIMLSTAIIWSLIVCWKLTLVGLASAPFIYMITRLYQAVSGKWEGRSNDAGTSAASIFTETFGNIRTVRALTLEAYLHEKYLKATEKAFHVGLRRSVYSGTFYGISDSGIAFATALIFYYGAKVAASRDFTVQNIVTVFSMLLFSIASANSILAFIPQINSSCATATRLLRLANLPHKSSYEHTGHVRLPALGTISFNDINFTYPSRPLGPVFNSLNLKLPPHTSIALVGASGSGKSTIASLILGLYPPSSGTLTFDSLAISTLHLPSLRSLIAVVPQTPQIFATTIALNVAYAMPERSPLASRANIEHAAEVAGIHTFIASLPRGYNTLIGEGGTGLSGGQAQRIAIARAVARKPMLMVLDEATSALDGESARGIRELVARLREKGVGVLMVTHDREMMRVCERIIVVKEGRVAETGGFEELVSRRGGELRRLLGGA
ncbi:MAG: hypothetical protein LQ339_000510 [Xanthoria mediterranea]|nr:MAG: hypothetical protein LQ339_000510 [Xanthoria mediterranea]